jgi:hypothetical protein
MMHDEICTYEVAKLAKEKGFPQDVSRWLDSTSPSRNYYNHKGELNGDCLEIIKCICRKEEVPIELQTIAAPTQSLLQRWLRDTHAIDIDIYPIFTDGDTDKREYGCQIYAVGKSNKPLRIGYAKSYENMLDKALKYALKNLVI